MSLDLTTLLTGAVGGGIATAGWRAIENYWLTPYFTASREAKKQLWRYAKPLAFSCDQAEYRLRRIRQQVKEGKNVGFRSIPENGASVQWFTKEGYYVASTAYLLASVSSWITLLQRDTVFLPFSRKSLMTQFMEHVEDFKIALSTRTFVWYLYVDSIGDRLVSDGEDRPISFSSFVFRMSTDVLFREHYDQLFQFLYRVAAREYVEQIEKTINRLSELKHFLTERADVPKITLTDRSISTDDRYW